MFSIYTVQRVPSIAVPLFMYMHGYLNDVATVRNYPYPALPHASYMFYTKCFLLTFSPRNPDSIRNEFPVHFDDRLNSKYIRICLPLLFLIFKLFKTGIINRCDSLTNNHLSNFKLKSELLRIFSTDGIQMKLRTSIC